ncbi:MAG: cupin domain-containing protein [Gammaproteobacteria bacterium]
MSTFKIAVVIALTIGTSAFAQTPVNIIHIPGSSLEPIPVAEWEVPNRDVDGPVRPRIRIAEGQEAVDRAPDNATRYQAKEYNFPMGSLRVLTFAKDAGPVLHQITFETELYMLQGSATVGVLGEQVSLTAGDAVFLPSGVLRNDNPSEDTVVALFMVSNTAENPESMVVHGADLTEMTIAQYVRDGEATTAVKPEDLAKAPEGAGIFDLKRYAFDGNSIRLAKLHKGGATTSATNGRTNILIYISKGRMRRTEDDKVYEVVAGDAIREELGKTGYWELLEESEFLATDMPFDPSKPRANPLRAPAAAVGTGYE